MEGRKSTTAVHRARRRRVAAQFATPQGGVVHRRQLREEGIGHDDVRAEVTAGRWVLMGRHTIFVGDPVATGGRPQDGPPTWPARAWWAVWESGSGAALTGVSALLAAGMTGFDDKVIQVAVPKGARPRKLPGVRRRRVRTVDLQPVGGLPRVRIEEAVITAAEWAVSDRQAALLVAMPVQQKLVASDRLLQAWRQRRRSRRRAFLDLVIPDVCDGAQALGELDFARLCRNRGLPAPSRQVVRTLRSGRVFLDVWWEDLCFGVEIDGAQHTQGLNAVDDALRHNEVVIEDGTLLRLPVLGLRFQEAAFMDQVERGYRQALHLIGSATHHHVRSAKTSGQREVL